MIDLLLIEKQRLKSLLGYCIVQLPYRTVLVLSSMNFKDNNKYRAVLPFGTGTVRYCYWNAMLTAIMPYYGTVPYSSTDHKK